ncbi:sensor histidine kinase, partial [Paenibacillus paridis]
MAKLEKNEAVVAMSHHLSNYYRYTTRQERDLVALSEEINFVTSYLEIQNMRMPRLNYTIDLPSDMLHLEIP